MRTGGLGLLLLVLVGFNWAQAMIQQLAAQISRPRHRRPNLEEDSHRYPRPRHRHRTPRLLTADDAFKYLHQRHNSYEFLKGSQDYDASDRHYAHYDVDYDDDYIDDNLPSVIVVQDLPRGHRHHHHHHHRHPYRYDGYHGYPYHGHPYEGYHGYPYHGHPYEGYHGYPYHGHPYEGYHGYPYHGHPYDDYPYYGRPYHGYPYSGRPYHGRPYHGRPYYGHPYHPDYPYYPEDRRGYSPTMECFDRFLSQFTDRFISKEKQESSHTVEKYSDRQIQSGSFGGDASLLFRLLLDLRTQNEFSNMALLQSLMRAQQQQQPQSSFFSMFNNLMPVPQQVAFLDFLKFYLLHIRHHQSFENLQPHPMMRQPLHDQFGHLIVDNFGHPIFENYVHDYPMTSGYGVPVLGNMPQPLPLTVPGQYLPGYVPPVTGHESSSFDSQSSSSFQNSQSSVNSQNMDVPHGLDNMHGGMGAIPGFGVVQDINTGVMNQNNMESTSNIAMSQAQQSGMDGNSASSMSTSSAAASQQASSSFANLFKPVETAYDSFPTFKQRGEGLPIRFKSHIASGSKGIPTTIKIKDPNPNKTSETIKANIKKPGSEDKRITSEKPEEKKTI